LTAASVDADRAAVHVVCGPTAAGKSDVAMWLAERAACVVISADSRQIYRGFDIGTAKPSAADRVRVPHRGIDVAEPTERYSAAAWAEAADGWIADAAVGGCTPLVVGGTGLYLRALFDGLFVEPALDAARRSALSDVLGSLERDELRRWATVLDPVRAHLGRTQLVRAIEIALLAGERVSDLHRRNARPPRWRARYLLVDPGPALQPRIAARLDHMLDHGWPDEVRRLMQTVSADAPAWNSTGYDAVRDWVAGGSTREQARERALIETRQYAKRQRTWFRHQLPERLVTQLDPTDADWHVRAARWFDGVLAPGEQGTNAPATDEATA
jgi:tRNA dimethylallyltransferase